MTDKVSEWISNLALDVYKLIQEYDAMSRFQEMVEKWAQGREAEIDKHKEWNEQRRVHFEQTVLGNHRLQDEQAGPPADGWQFENHVQHKEKKTESGWQRIHNIIPGWVPPKLSYSSKPEITHIFPLGRDHELTLEEKYTCLAVIYEYGRKGTTKLPPWQWPDLSLEQPEKALSNAKKCLFFEGLCDGASKLNLNEEGWLRTLLDDVETDVRNWKGVKSPQLKENIQTVSSETRIDRWVRQAKNHPIISIIIFICIVIIAVGTVVTQIDRIITFFNRTFSKEPEFGSQAQKVSDTRILSATSEVEVLTRSDEEVNTLYAYSGASLAFAKGKEPLLIMSSKECRAEQTGKGEVRYSGTLDMKATDKAFKRPLSLLKEAEYIQISFEPIPPDSYILSGKVICIFNNNIPIEISIPSQKIAGKLIMINDIDPILSALKEL